MVYKHLTSAQLYKSYIRVKFVALLYKFSGLESIKDFTFIEALKVEDIFLSSLFFLSVILNRLSAKQNVLNS